MINKRLLQAGASTKPLMLQKIIFNWLSLLSAICFYASISVAITAVGLGNANIAPSLLVGPMFFNLYQALGSKVLIGICALASIVFIVLRYYFTKHCSKIAHDIASAIKMDFRCKIYNKLQKVGASYTSHFKTAELTQLASEGVEQLETYFSNYIPQLVFSLLAPLTLFVIYAQFSIETAVVLLVCVPLIPVAIAAVGTFAKKLLGRYWSDYVGLSDTFLENLQGLTTLKVYGADKRKQVQMNKDAQKFRKVTMQVLTMQLNSITIMDIIAYGATALGTIICAMAFMNNQITFVQAIFMCVLASEFFLSLRILGSYFHVAMNGVAAADRMFLFLNLPEQEGGNVQAENGEITITNLNFAYNAVLDSNSAQASAPTNDAPASTPTKLVLSNINLSIKKGSFVSVVGKSGCGKSTLAQILCRQLPYSDGQILLSAGNLNQISNINDLICLVSLSGYIFKGSLRYNLLMGNKNASDQQLLQALEQVNLLDLANLEGGLDYQLQERGSNLSGGQRQRLLIARALLKNAPIYIFDEATSNIDAYSEKIIVDAILRLKGKHTIIQITHRLQNVINSDTILYLEDGKIVQQGNHEQLMQQNGRYKDLFVAQLELENISKTLGGDM